MICTTSLDSANGNMGENSPEIINLLSDLEEGELEELSDVSSDEELLLRQRIEILENYNSVLEKKFRREQSICKETTNDLSRKKDKVHKGKRFHRKKKTATIKVHASKKHKRKKRNFSSDSDVEIKKKKILREAVGIGGKKSNPTSLKNRLFPFIKNNVDKCSKNSHELNDVIFENCKEELSESNDLPKHSDANDNTTPSLPSNENIENSLDAKANQPIENNVDASKIQQSQHEHEKYVSEDDAELLRELALNSKAKRKDASLEINSEDVKVNKENLEDLKNSDDSDSDIAELRIIALRSAMLKKAMERKRQRKESRRKRNSKRFRTFSMVLSDLEDIEIKNDNGTDIEEVDMDVDPDTFQNSQSTIYYDQALDPTQRSPFAGQQEYENLSTENQVYQHIYNDLQYYDSNNYILQPIKQFDTCNIKHFQESQSKYEELEEDEDILRAKLLNSISSINSKTIADNITKVPTTPQVPVSKYDDSNLIIRLGDSDSESDCEETKQLIKTNQKILKETLFQRKLDNFLKEARSKVENAIPSTPKNTVATSPTVKKHTPVAVKHLPAADQQEYRQLLKRMSELQKIKMAKQQQAMINSIANKSKDDDKTASDPPKDILKNSNGKKEAKETNTLSRDRNVPTRKEVVESNQGIEKQQKMTKTLELHLELTRQKISNYSRTMKRLDMESKTLKSKYSDLKVQAQEIEIALRSTRNKLSENQRQSNTANKNLSKLQKHEEILRNKIKNLSVDLNRNVKGNINHVSSTYSTKIMMKNKVINKKSNVNKNNSVPQNKTGLSIVNRVEKLSKPLSKTVENSTVYNKKAMAISKVDRNTLSEIKAHQIVTDNSFMNKLKQSGMSESVNENIAITLKIALGDSKTSDTNNPESTSKRSVTISTRNTSKANDTINENDIKSSAGFDLKMNNGDKSNKLDVNEDSLNSDINKEEFLQNSNKNNCEISTDVIMQSNMSPKSCDKDNPNVILIESNEPAKTSKGETKITESQAIDFVDNTLYNEGQMEDSITLDTVINENYVPVLNHSHRYKCLNIQSKHVNAESLEYKSPLLALKDLNTRVEDVQAIFCPFEVGGSCKDPECKYLHPKSS